MRLAANYNVLSDFLRKMPPEKAAEVLKRFISGIESDTNTGLEKAMDIADSFTGLDTATGIIGVIHNELQSNLERCERAQQYFGIQLYSILLQVFDLVKQKDDFSKLWTTLGNYETLKRNNLQDAYIRPLIYSPANMSFNKNTESTIVITAWEMSPFLGEKLLRVMTSSFQRPNPKGFKIEAKASGHYVNSILASQEAKANGYDEALLTDMNGFIAEGPGANVFYEKDGKLFTPSTGNILPGITRATVLELCNELDIPVEEKLFTADELKEADAAFFCGTAAEVIGWESLDEVNFPKPWQNTLSKTIQEAYKHRVIKKEYKPSLELA